MRPLFVLLLLGINLYAVDPPTAFHNCILSARVANPNGTLYKSYKCSGFLVGISGTWSPHINGGVLLDMASDYAVGSTGQR